MNALTFNPGVRENKRKVCFRDWVYIGESQEHIFFSRSPDLPAVASGGFHNGEGECPGASPRWWGIRIGQRDF